VIGLTGCLAGSLISGWLLVFPAAYLLTLVGVGFKTLRSVGTPAMVMPIALAVMHLSWGVGFLTG
jgi:hypothetical protein